MFSETFHVYRNASCFVDVFLDYENTNSLLDVLL